MAKNYADSVKLPNLVPIAHPAVRLSRNGLNIEGLSTTSNQNKSTTNLLNHTVDRRSFIVGLLQNSNTNNNDFNKYNLTRRKQKQTCTNSDELFTMIDEKLTTGYYGVKHLFNTNEVEGRLSKESFKCVLSQLCGYINNETWQKISSKFDLSNGISFAEFITHFDNNQKVKKELINSKNVQLIDISHEVINRDMNKKILLPELSATYCLALLKAKTKENDFDPKTFLDRSCFENNQLVMPFHLIEVLENMKFKLSSVEFEKLWRRLDLKNTGCIKTHVFLRLINWRPNQIDEFSEQMDMLRARSCIADEQTVKRILVRRRSKMSKHKRQTADNEGLRQNLKSESISYFDSKSVYGDVGGNHKNEVLVVVDEDGSSLRSRSAIEDHRAELRTCQTSVSEARIKSMVKNLNMTQKFGFNDDLVVFLNSRLNEGYISMKAAFEYIDPDHLSHLLADEFRYVLKEFNIFFDADSTYEKFLTKHDLKKHTNLVDYEKFLQIFQDQSASSISTSLSAISDKSYNALSDSVKNVEKRLVEFFHGASFLCHSSFKEQNIKNENPNVCSLSTFRKLLEQSFSIIISNSQLDTLIEFLNKRNECEKTGLINWTEMLKKFSEINPWNCFKESYEVLSRRKSRLAGGSSFSHRTTKTFRSDLSHNVIKEEKSNADRLGTDESDQEDDGIQMVSSDEEDDQELAKLNSSMEEDKADKNEEKVFDEAAESERVAKRAAKKLQKKVVRNIEKVFRKKFHSITKQLAIVDSKKTEKLDKLMFGALMGRVGLNLTSDELNFVWKDYDENEKVPFSNLCRRFIIPEEFDRLRKIKEEIDRENKLNEELKKSRPKARPLPGCHDVGMRLKSSGSNVNLSSLNNLESDESLYLIKKSRIVIGLNWTEMKKIFLKIDTQGLSRVASDRAVDVLQQFHVPLDEEEAFDLCRVFCFNKSSHEFDYVKFLKYFKPVTDGHNDDQSRRMTSQQQQTYTLFETNATLKKIIIKLREKYSGKEASDRNTLAKDLSSLKALFKKFDVSRKGHLSFDELKQALGYCQVTVDANELYLMQSEFDPELRGVFCYELCIKSLIEKNLSTV